jgi:large subunit ribosomal protein L7Ae
MANYRPESVQEKKTRLLNAAKSEVKGAEQDPSKKPKMIKFGLNHITSLVESKKAKLVVIAHDVDPIDLVLWLPALCRKMDVPYVIVKGKARLGALVHQKNAAAVAITEVRKEHQAALTQFVENTRSMYSDAAAASRKWGGGIMGNKAQVKVAQRERALARERAAVKA